MSTADIAVWQTFFSVTAQVGATLAGLLFVGLTISLQHVLAARGYLARAFSALFLQLEILLVGLFGLLPGQPPYILGIEFVAIGVTLFVGIRAFGRNFPEDENSTILGTSGLRAFRSILTLVGTLSAAASGVALIAGWHYALYLLMPGIVAAVYQAIGYAWVFAVEIPRRIDDGKKL